DRFPAKVHPWRLRIGHSRRRLQMPRGISMLNFFLASLSGKFSAVFLPFLPRSTRHGRSGFAQPDRRAVPCSSQTLVGVGSAVLNHCVPCSCSCVKFSECESRLRGVYSTWY